MSTFHLMANRNTFVNFVDYRMVISQVDPEQLAYYKQLLQEGKYIPGTASEKIAMIMGNVSIF